MKTNCNFCTQMTNACSQIPKESFNKRITDIKFLLLMLMFLSVAKFAGAQGCSPTEYITAQGSGATCINPLDSVFTYWFITTGASQSTMHSTDVFFEHGFGTYVTHETYDPLDYIDSLEIIVTTHLAPNTFSVEYTLMDTAYINWEFPGAYCGDGVFTLRDSTSAGETFGEFAVKDTASYVPFCQGDSTILTVNGWGGAEEYFFLPFTGSRQLTTVETDSGIISTYKVPAGNYSITFNGVKYGNPDDTCSYTTNINVVANPTYQETLTADTACNSYALPWDTTITQTGEYCHNYLTVKGCDSLVCVNVTINYSHDTTYSVTACNSYALQWDTTITQSGQYCHNYATVHGCDSLVCVNVTINYSHDTTYSATACNSYALQWDTTVTQSGQYCHNYATVHGCDSLVCINVTINYSHDTTYSATACNSYALQWDTTVTQSGQYCHNYATVHGCDSLVCINVTINYSHDTTYSATACNSFALQWDTTVTQSGQYCHNYATVHGCDSLVCVNVTINYSHDTTYSATTCNSYALQWDTTVTQSGQYCHNYATVHGCDSLVCVNVTINYRHDTTYSATACNSYALQWDTTVTQSGQYCHNYATVHGCDSLVCINVTINYSHDTTYSATACNSYALQWDTTVTQSGQYCHNYATVHGCDSLVCVNVTINYRHDTTYSATACNSYALQWDTTVTQSGQYCHNYATVHGCDSLVCVNVTVNYSDSSSLSVTACNNYSLPWEGLVTTSGEYCHHYQTVKGCDSVLCINVIIHPSYDTLFSATACGSYNLPWDSTVTQTGEYCHQYQTVNGCDSSVCINVTINNQNINCGNNGPLTCSITSVTLTATVSSGTTVVWSPGGQTTTSITVSTAGTYTVTATSSSNGCTSVCTTNVGSNITPPPANCTPPSPISCSNTCTELQVNSCTPDGNTYNWSGPGGYSSTSQCPCVSVVGTYTVTVIGTNGCTSTCTETVTGTPGAPITGSCKDDGPVYPSNLFQLTGNPNSSHSLSGDDWDIIYDGTSTTAQYITAPGIKQPNGGILVGQEISFVEGTKDILDIPDWSWREQHVPDKDLLLNAGAALYDGHYLYFFSDRYATNGDAQMGIWLLQDGGALQPNGTFSGQHQKGDLLILSDFVNGGGVPVIFAYEWVGTGGNTFGTLNKIALNTTSYPDAYATVNSASYQSPWPFAPKFGPQNVLSPGAFFEGGIDLKCLVPDVSNLCSFLFETRASQEPTAELKNFIVGSLVPNQDYNSGRMAEQPSSGNGNVSLHAYPNPFSDITTIELLPNINYNNATLDLYDISGQKVSSIFAGPVVANQTYRFLIDGSKLVPGIYYYNFRSENESITGKIVLIK